MKTALTEYIEYLEGIKERDNIPNHVITTAKNYLEPEKNQIIDFANKCQMVREVDCDENVIFSFKPEELFEQTFHTTNKETLK